jgi:hypothetical protein
MISPVRRAFLSRLVRMFSTSSYRIQQKAARWRAERPSMLHGNVRFAPRRPPSVLRWPRSEASPRVSMRALSSSGTSRSTSMSGEIPFAIADVSLSWRRHIGLPSIFGDELRRSMQSRKNF